MNREHVQATIDLMRNSQKVDFDMTIWAEPAHSSCKSVCCVAGYAVLASGEDPTRMPSHYVSIAAAIYLGLREKEAEQLFTPRELRLELIRKEDAIAALEHLRDTGNISWDSVDEAIIDRGI